MAGQTSEVEETLKRLQGHKGVIGVVIVNQDGIPIRTTFDQAVTVQYAGLITQLCSKARSAVRELDAQVCLVLHALDSVALRDHLLACRLMYVVELAQQLGQEPSACRLLWKQQAVGCSGTGTVVCEGLLP